MKKRVMLIVMPIPIGYANTLADASFEQTGLGYISSILEERGHNVFLFDAYSRGASNSEIIQKIRGFDPDFLCASPTYLSWHGTIRMLEAAKKLNPKIQTVLGGPHVSFEPVLSRALKEFSCIDYLVRGEGEKSVLPIVENIIPAKTNNIPGICYKDSEGKPHISQQLSEEIHNLDELPFPLRDIEPLSGKSLRITTSRGCYQKGKGCAFCQLPAQNPFGWRCRSPENVVDEMEFWASKGHTSFVCAEGDFLGVSGRGICRAQKIAEEILRRNVNVRLRIFGEIRQIICADKRGVLSLLKRAGLERVYPGVEAGNQDDLELYQKNITVHQIRTAGKILKRRRIGLQIGFIMFNPWSTDEKLKANVRLLEEIDQAHLWFNSAYKLGLFPGTRLLDKVEAEGLLLEPMAVVGLGTELVHNYKFKVSYIERVAKVCGKILAEDDIIQTDRQLITIEVLTSDYSEFPSNVTTPATMRNLRKQYEKIREALTRLNTMTFLTLLQSCKDNHSDKELTNITNKHLAEVRRIIPEIHKLETTAKRAMIRFVKTPPVLPLK